MTQKKRKITVHEFDKETLGEGGGPRCKDVPVGQRLAGKAELKTHTEIVRRGRETAARE